MLTVLNAIKLASEYFEKKEIDSPRVNAEILLAHLLNCKRLDLYLRFDQPLSEIEINSYRDLIARRGKFEPVQYIIGSVEFYGLQFDVNTSVLIPRPETEILVETIINNYINMSDMKILDIGTGSGNIAISLAKKIGSAQVTGIDISDDALKLAEKNASKNEVTNIKFVKVDILNPQALNGQVFDIIVSNPPYIREEEYPKLQKEITSFEPKIALSDFEDGLKFYRHISEFAQVKLNNNGSLYFEVGIGQSSSVEKILFDNGFKDIQIVKDYQQIERIIFGIKK